MDGQLALEARAARRRSSGAPGHGRSPTPVLVGAGASAEGALGLVQYGVDR